MVRITTWNVNGIRNPFGYQPWSTKRTFDAMFDILEADIVIMQELKIQRKDLTDDMVLVPGWDCFFSLPKHKKGYSGVGVYTRQSMCCPIRAEEGLLGVLNPPGSTSAFRDQAEGCGIGGYLSQAQIDALGVDPVSLDSEGRCVLIEFPAFVLFGVYSPANSNGQRDDFRYSFISALDTRIRNLTRDGKRVVLTGDLNVSREEIDTANAEEQIRKDGITREDYLNAPNRRIFNQLLANGDVPGYRDSGRDCAVLWDTCREFHPKRKGMYTHWEQKINARPANYGSRIDFVLCSTTMSSWIQKADIQEGLMGSDHCPVFAVTKEVVDYEDQKVHILDIMNPIGMFKDGVRLRDINPLEDLLPCSGKLMPEFDKRRSIRDMFKTKLSNKRKNAEITSPIALKKTPYTLDAPVSTVKQPQSSNQINLNLISPIKPSLKRNSSSLQEAVPNKNRKSSLASNSQLQSISTKGQQSLKGFLVSKSRTNSSDFPQKLDHNIETPIPPSPDPKSPDDRFPKFPLSPSADAQSSKESWVKLFSRKPPPRCEGHREPCISRKTKKPGVNWGRVFWMCPRPTGPTGQKERGTEWQCGTFIWASDWNAPDTKA